ncbi:MAG: hypothetical protein H6603_10200 [Flavobacteriales bacterium]|nr:hypothetical protein [Flavobacteriales bacterium]MCB9205335.1 hypothetical protein [Flavobacteriales bacterium]
MEGKVFASSTNVYQDQAKVLFDYYRKAAEKIVAEEEQYEKEMAICEEEILQHQAKVKKSTLIRNVCFGLFFLVIPLIIAFLQIQKLKELEQLIQQTTTRKEGFESAHKEIFRDYKVSKMGLAYVPVATRIPFENKSFIIDFTGKVDQQHFQLNTLKQTELFTRAVSDLDGLMKSTPVVDGSNETELVETDDYSLSIQSIPYHDYYGQVDRALRTSAFCLDDLDHKSVSLPVVMPNSGYADQLRQFGASRTGNAPVLNVFDPSRYKEEVERFHSLNQMKKSLENEHTKFEEGLRIKMMDVARSVQAITQVKLASSNHLIDSSNKLLLQILKCSYNHYSSNLESEEIDRIRFEKFNYQDSLENYKPFHLKQSSRVRYDVISEKWVAEDGSKTSYPFGIHQIHEEIVAPIVQNLMAENRKERLKIYNSIKDQKIDYLNQWHRDTEDFYARNRAESNGLIDKMRSTLSEYISSYNAMVALKKTGESLEKGASLASGVVEDTDNESEVFAAFEVKSNEFKAVQSDFSDYMDRLKEDIDRRAEKFEHIEYYDASLRDATFRSYAIASSKVNSLDQRRSPLASVNPFFAETSELPPEPSMEAITNEHLSINLPKFAQRALDELDGIATQETSDSNDGIEGLNDQLEVDAEVSFDDNVSSAEDPSEHPFEQRLDGQLSEEPEDEDSRGEDVSSSDVDSQFTDTEQTVSEEKSDLDSEGFADDFNEETTATSANATGSNTEDGDELSDLNMDAQTVTCGACGTENAGGAEFCEGCGNKLV